MSLFHSFFFQFSIRETPNLTIELVERDARSFCGYQKPLKKTPAILTLLYFFLSSFIKCVQIAHVHISCYYYCFREFVLKMCMCVYFLAFSFFCLLRPFVQAFFVYLSIQYYCIYPLFSFVVFYSSFLSFLYQLCSSFSFCLVLSTKDSISFMFQLAQKKFLIYLNQYTLALCLSPFFRFGSVLRRSLSLAMYLLDSVYEYDFVVLYEWTIKK